ncbi:hypothetical protein SERLA73DRAFT_128875 [Serpula lacrymans var. lacrymans S7.3]|uniref:Uncharacterized protein n=2 Tax=Serpula lacrymans var. lacrymans TaxID=341189 RepID=F8PI81_SERL3|nr:uncharacterized protein SERLADRAFT_376108 [Serpula lacrymans var. lacrymans S7.9]EGO05124.1 hypothetical protein SERLA73DRAFT_128875 [Serpula lacrymans var. lacrymans S7.3]EGO30879.1 hypothetical protein SERLADRAFT_376108 [Serpula lacrymans var. lacrymans S7.9]
MGALDNHSLDDKRVGALAIPVPSYSPPVSALSLSSPSSVSRSAISNTADNSGESSISTSVMFSPLKVGRDIELGGLCGSEQRPSLHDLSVGDQTSGDSTLVAHGRSDHWDYVELGPQCSEHKVKAEAKSNRKIADLEITNRSLLAINASLENTKHRQAKEIRDLRRKLRDSRLSLSPGTFRVLNSSPYLSESDHDEEDEGTDNGRKGKGDVLYEKIKMMLEELIVSGEKALDTVGKTEKTRE